MSKPNKKNTLKGSDVKIKWDLDDDSIFTNVVWYTTLIKERIKSHDNHKRFRKSFWQNSTSFYKKKTKNSTKWVSKEHMLT